MKTYIYFSSLQLNTGLERYLATLKRYKIGRFYVT